MGKVFALILAIGLLCAAPLQAADVCVDDISDGAADSTDCDADCADPSPDCSLRDAIAKAVDGDRIFFDPTVHGFSTGLTEGNYLITNDISIEGPGSANFTISGLDASQVFNLQAVVNISGLTVNNGLSTGIGGCIFVSNAGDVTLDDLVVANCEIDTAGAAGGAGICNDGTLTITNSTIRDNKLKLGATGGIVGGGIQNLGDLTVRNSLIQGNAAGLGGGIFSGTGTLVLDKVTLQGNVALNSGGGGGINLASSGTTATLTNVTISGNLSSDLDGFGGGISVNNSASATLIHCTLAENSAINGGNIGNFNSGTLTLINSLSANSSAGGDCFTAFGGSVVDGGGNLIEDGSCGFDVGGDPNLAGLEGIDGILMHALLSPSPAIDGGDSGECAAEDQRGVPRPLGLTCDIGAFEFEPPPSPTPSPTPSSTPTASPSPEATATPQASPPPDDDPEEAGGGGCSLQPPKTARPTAPGLAVLAATALAGAGILRGFSRGKTPRRAVTP